MPKITNTFVEKLSLVSVGEQAIFRDPVLRGFAIRVTHGCKSYVVEARVNGIVRRITLGKHGALTADAARKKAKRFLASMADGRDPVLEKTHQRIATVTLQDVLEHYLSVRNVRPNTRRHYTYILPRCLGDWLDKPVATITREMVEKRHKELRRTTRQGSCGEVQANAAMRILGILLHFAAANYEIDGRPIILVDPVKRLSQNHQWYREYRRQTIIHDHQLPAWYAEVMALRNDKVRDYLLLLLFTGLRRTEAATLKWTDIDFLSKVLTVRAEVAKNKREHRLPLSNVLLELFMRRKELGSSSEYVFPGRGGRGHIVDSGHVIDHVIKRSGVSFTLHDCRRTFLTVAERSGLPYVVLQKLANHSGRNDTTFGYLIVDVERLRQPMQQVSNNLLELVGMPILTENSARVPNSEQGKH